jgi:hypothetical protein
MKRYLPPTKGGSILRKDSYKNPRQQLAGEDFLKKQCYEKTKKLEEQM